MLSIAPVAIFALLLASFTTALPAAGHIAIALDGRSTPTVPLLTRVSRTDDAPAVKRSGGICCNGCTPMGSGSGYNCQSCNYC